MTFKERELANKEKRLAETGLKELAAMRRTVEELHATRAIEAQKVWDFLVPLGFSPVRSGEPAREVSTMLPVFDFVGARMLMLEEVVSKQLETEGGILAEKVEEHMLMCF
jgi:hypothetical protein